MTEKLPQEGVEVMEQGSETVEAAVEAPVTENAEDTAAAEAQAEATKQAEANQAEQIKEALSATLVEENGTEKAEASGDIVSSQLAKLEEMKGIIMNKKKGLFGFMHSDREIQMALAGVNGAIADLKTGKSKEKDLVTIARAAKIESSIDLKGFNQNKNKTLSSNSHSFGGGA